MLSKIVAVISKVHSVSRVFSSKAEKFSPFGLQASPPATTRQVAFSFRLRSLSYDGTRRPNKLGASEVPICRVIKGLPLKKESALETAAKKFTNING